MFDILDFIDSKEIRTCNSNRKFNPIQQQERALSYRISAEDAVFSARLMEEEFPDDRKENVFFSSYEKALAFLQEKKQVYLNEEELKKSRPMG